MLQVMTSARLVPLPPALKKKAIACPTSINFLLHFQVKHIPEFAVTLVFAHFSFYQFVGQHKTEI